MADNVLITQGSGTTVATDDVGGIQYQRVKVAHGADGVATDTSTAAPLPVTLANTGANSTAVAVTDTAATRPNSTTMQSSAVANGNGTSLTVTGYSTAILSVVSSVAMGGGTTVNFEATTDDTNWVSIKALRSGTDTIASTTLTDGEYQLNVAGFTKVRARISAYSAGTISVLGYKVSNAAHPSVVNANVTSAIPAGTNNIGSVGTYLVSGPQVGQTTSNATAQQLNGGSSIAATNGVLVQALAANTNNVYIGGSGVTSSNGYELQPGQAVSFTVDNINDLYVIGGSGSDKCCWNVL